MRWRSVCALAVVALAVTACTGDDRPSANPSPAATALPSPAAAPPPAHAAALGLYQAWLEGDERAAAAFATPDAVDQLFGYEGHELQFNSCSRAGAKFRCFFYYEGGGLNMNVEGSAATGYLVTKAFFIAD